MAKRRRKRQQPSEPQVVQREKPYVPKAGEGQIFTQEGERESRRYRNVGHPLDLALSRNQINQELWSSGNQLRLLCEKTGRSGKDSTQALMAPVNGGESTPWAQGQADAIRLIEKIEHAMPTRDYRIARKFCGEGCSITEAVTAITLAHPNTAIYRLREALEQLSDAMDRLRIARAA